jgi:hypothetical protein
MGGSGTGHGATGALRPDRGARVMNNVKAEQLRLNHEDRVMRRIRIRAALLV